MSAFLEQLQKDVDTTFLNQREFASTHRVGGRGMPVTLDTSQLDELKAKAQYAEEIYKAEMILSVRPADLGYKPAVGSTLEVDGHIYRVRQVSGALLYRLILEANE